MLFARWRHHLRFASSFTYAPFNVMVTKISKWYRIQDSCRITPKIESLVGYAMPDIPSKFQKNLSITFRVMLLTHRQTNRQTKTGKNITEWQQRCRVPTGLEHGSPVDRWQVEYDEENVSNQTRVEEDKLADDNHINGRPVGPFLYGQRTELNVDKLNEIFW